MTSVETALGMRHPPSAGFEARASEALLAVICHSEELFRAGLVQHLRLHPDLAIVAHAAHPESAFKLCRKHCPRVFLCDTGGGLSVAQIARGLRAASPESRLILIGREREDAVAVLRQGAWGIIGSNSPGDHFARAIRVVAGGQFWAGRETLNNLAREALNSSAAAKPAKPVLSRRELEILELVSAGHTNFRIADLLFVEVNTVRTHMRRIYQKLEVHDRTSAVIQASKRGLLTLEKPPLR